MKDILESITYLVTFLVGVLTPLFLILLPAIALFQAKKWKLEIVFQSLCSLFIWAVLSVGMLYIVVLNFLNAFNFNDDTVNSSEKSYQWLLPILCIPYSLIGIGLVCAIVYGIKLQMKKDQ